MLGFFKKEKKIPEYKELWENCALDSKLVEDKKHILFLTNKYKEVYYQLYSLTGVPWFVCFAIHYKEASCSFKGVLHNGDEIIGTGAKTFNEPKGRGPFLSWADAAIDALLMKQNIFPRAWTIPECLLFCEKYNGLGHRNHGEYSPYVWAGTNHSDETGNYVSDGKYKSDAMIKSIGVACIFKILQENGLL